MAVEAAYFRLPDNKFYVVLAAKIPGSAVSFLRKSATHQTEFDFAWRAISSAGDSAGRPVAVLRDTLPVKLNADTYQQVLSGNILYEGGIVLPPGKYHLKVVARENESGKLGSFEESLALPVGGQTGLALSSVVVSNQLQDAGGGKSSRRQAKGVNANPLELGSRSVLPSVTRVFRTDQNLYVYLESYESQAGSKEGLVSHESGDAGHAAQAASTPPSVALVLFRSGVKISEAGPFLGKIKKDKNAKGKAEYFVQILLAKFPPGRYWMQVNVLDPSAERVAFARVPIAIIKAPATSAHAGK
jgi:hypothetical protein